jgi:aspartate racemase
MAKKAKRIGILGGISYQSTIKYYELIHQWYFERNKDYYYPEIVIFSLNFQKFTDYETVNHKEFYIEYIMEGIQALQNAGTDFIIMAANSVHSVCNEIKHRARVPIVSIVDAVVHKCKAERISHVLLLGIKFTMQSSFYPEALVRNGMKVTIPSESEQNEINRIIFEELTVGIFHHHSKKKLLEIIGKYDVDGVILGCTELPLIIRQEDTTIKLLDTLELHAEAALNYALAV